MRVLVEKFGILGQCIKIFGLILISYGLIYWQVVDPLGRSELSLVLVCVLALVSAGVTAKNTTRRVYTRLNAPVPF